MSSPVERPESIDAPTADGTADRLRVGVIGCGSHASLSIHPNLAAAGLSIEAVCTRSMETARRSAQRLGVGAAFDDPGEMLETLDLDGIIVVVQPPQYADLVAVALDQGVPVFTDKPGAASVEEAVKLAALSHETGVPVVVGYQKRFAQAYQVAKEILAADDFGQVTMASFSWSVGPVSKSLQDWLFENPVHHFDLARFLLGELDVAHVVRGEVEGGHALVIAATTAGGAPVSLQINTTGSWNQRNEVVEIFGVGNAVVVENVDTCTWRPPERPERVWRPNYTVPLSHNSSAVTMGFAGELAHFREVIAGAAKPVSDMVSAAGTLRLTDEIARRALSPERADA